MRSSLFLTALSVAALAAPAGVAAHDDDTAAAQLGTVSFMVSCTAGAQREFDIAMAYQQSFAQRMMRAPFECALKEDPACGLMCWARVLAPLDNPFGWPESISAATLADGPRCSSRCV